MNAPNRATMKPDKGKRAGKAQPRESLRDKRSKNLQARMDALVPYLKEYDGADGDIDGFRLAFARRIAMYVGTEQGYWRGCRHANCRRQRMCIAPDIRCANAPPPPPDPDGRLWDRTRLELRRALDRLEAEGKFDELDKDGEGDAP